MRYFYDLLIGKYGYDVSRGCRFENSNLSLSFQDCLLQRMMNDNLEDFLPQIDHLFSLAPDFQITYETVVIFDQKQD